MKIGILQPGLVLREVGEVISHGKQLSAGGEAEDLRTLMGAKSLVNADTLITSVAVFVL